MEEKKKFSGKHFKLKQTLKIIISKSKVPSIYISSICHLVRMKAWLSCVVMDIYISVNFNKCLGCI
jgi:hypothetical protein